MFDALLKSKFYIRSKSEIKTTKKRIEIIKRKRTAMEKFLRNDVAELLKNDLDSDAYSRVEQLYADQNLSSCYEFVEQSCLFILSHLSAMEKNRECPEECKQAISTLMFAAARFADLPELRELRSLFAERYGNYLEPYVNQEFVKNLKADPPSKETKLQMMQEIALECGIKWDSKALGQKLDKPPPFVKDLPQYANERNNESCKPHHQNGLETDAQETEKNYSNKQTEVAKNDDTFGNGVTYKSRAQVEKKEENHMDQTVGKGLVYKSGAEVEDKEEKHKDQTVGNELPFKSRAKVEQKEEKHKDQTVGNGLQYKSRAEIEKNEEGKYGHGRVSPYWSSNSSSCSESTASPGYSTDPDDSASEDFVGRKFFGFRSMAPPYVIKTDSSKKATSWDTSSGPGRNEEVAQPDFKDVDLQSGSKDMPEGRKFYGFRSMDPPYTKTDSTSKGKNLDTASSSGREEEVVGSKCKDNNLKCEEEAANSSKPVPRSMRIRRPLKPVAGAHSNNEVPKPSPNILNGGNHDHDHDHIDNEEKKTDKLLSHYSRKPSKVPCDSRMENNGCREVPAPARMGSLPAESFTASEEKKGLARAATYSGLSPRGHVHPKLPDYDDFVARLAALRASS